MPKYDTTRRMPFTPEQMYQLVADVERYPEFVPMCESLTVHAREERACGSMLTASMGIGYGALKESFTTRVELEPDIPRIVVSYLDGPFKHLENRWTFRPANDALKVTACDVDFWIDYEFRSPILAVLMGSVFDKAFRKFTDAFEARARVIYGSG